MISKSESLVKAADGYDIKLRDHGYALLDSGWRYPRTALPMSRLYFCKSDGGIIEYDNGEIRARKGFVYLLPVNFKFGYRVEMPWEKLFVHFVIMRRDGYDLLSELDKICEYELGEEKIDSLISLYNGNNTRDAFDFKLEIYNTVNAVLESVSFRPKEQVFYSPLVESAIEYVKAHLSIKLSIAEIAANCFISESLLSKRFRDEYGITLGKYIDDLVFFSAQNMLIGTNLPISRISESLGFCDQFYFSRRFRQFAGVSPRYYRKYRY